MGLRAAVLESIVKLESIIERFPHGEIRDTDFAQFMLRLTSHYTDSALFALGRLRGV